MKYQVFLNKKAEKTLSKMEKSIAKRISEKITQISEDPRHNGAIKLSGEENSYRVKIGDYRIIYEIYDSKIIVIITNIGDRKEVYKK